MCGNLNFIEKWVKKKKQKQSRKRKKINSFCLQPLGSQPEENDEKEKKNI